MSYKQQYKICLGIAVLLIIFYVYWSSTEKVNFVLPNCGCDSMEKFSQSKKQIIKEVEEIKSVVEEETKFEEEEFQYLDSVDENDLNIMRGSRVNKSI